MPVHLEDQLAQLLRDYGLIILKEPRRFKALLLDTARNAHQAEVHVLSQCVERGIPVQIQQMEQQQHHDLIINRLVQQLKDDMWLDEKRANDVIELWSRILLNKSSTSAVSSIFPAERANEKIERRFSTEWLRKKIEKGRLAEKEEKKIESEQHPLVASDAWLDELIAWADENEISEVDFPRDKQEILDLTKLQLSFGEIKNIPEGIGILCNLTELQLKANILEDIPDSIGKLSNLSHLDLSFNELNSVPNSIGKLDNLTVLNLTNNRLTSIPESIGKLSNLTKLLLSENELTDIPKSIGKLRNLTKLSLGGNQLTNMHNSIYELRERLATMDVSRN